MTKRDIELLLIVILFTLPILYMTYGISMKSLAILVFMVPAVFICVDSIKSSQINQLPVLFIGLWGLICNFFNWFGKASQIKEYIIFHQTVPMQECFVDAILGIVAALIVLTLINLIMNKLLSSGVPCIGAGAINLFGASCGLVGFSGLYNLLMASFLAGILVGIYPMVKNYIVNKRYKKLIYYVLLLFCGAYVYLKHNLLIYIAGTIFLILYFRADNEKTYEPVLIPFAPCISLATLVLLII